MCIGRQGHVVVRLLQCLLFALAFNHGSALALDPSEARGKFCEIEAHKDVARDEARAARWNCGRHQPPRVRAFADFFTDCVTRNPESTEETYRRQDEEAACRRCVEHVRVTRLQFSRAQNCRRALTGPHWQPMRDDEVFDACIVDERNGAARRLVFNETASADGNTRERELRYCRRGAPRQTPGPAEAPQLRCAAYAEAAVAAVQQAQRSDCQLSGPRYTPSYDEHFIWCQSAQPEWIRAEEAARRQEVSGCETCRQYAKRAIQSAAAARRCTFGRPPSGPLWDRSENQYFGECKGALASGNFFDVIVQNDRAREDYLNSCTRPLLR